MTQQVQSLDLTECDREPIRTPGGIQPHGCLIVADARMHRVSHASANVQEHFRRPVDQVLGSSLDAILPQAVSDALRTRRDDWSSSSAGANRLGSAKFDDGTMYDVLIHQREQRIFLEFEAVADEGRQADAEWLSGQMLNFVSELETARDFMPLCATLARQIRTLIDFDRVLIYQFDRDWNGVVVGEDRNDNLPSYFDLRFPASDIPAQARELYRVNRSRLIVRADYTPVPIVALPDEVAPLDLTLSTLRSVSPVHLEYMKNMGTAASSSFSILRNGELWGLIACHNSVPRQVRFDVRRACELIARTFSLQVESIASRESAELRAELAGTRSALLRALARSHSLDAGLDEHGEQLAACTRAAGVALAGEDHILTHGPVPVEPFIRALADWLSQRGGGDELFATNQLGSLFTLSDDTRAVASGVLAVRISQFQKSWLIWFRPEVTQTVTWAGDPRKAASAGPYENRLHPRQSFEAWKQTVSGVAAPWEPAEREAALSLRSDLISIVLRKAEELASITEELQRSNKELEAFSYSVSHDLRAPFRHIVGYSELLSELEAAHLSDRGQRYIHTVIEAARTAGKLIDNLLLFSRMGRSGLSSMPIDMNRLFAEVRHEVIKSEAIDRHIEWDVADLPPAWGDPNMLRLAVRNLVSNAVKYSRGRSPAHIAIMGKPLDGGVEYAVRDDGVGFDMQYVDKLFGVFQRLHAVEQFEGTGIGLANVQRIVTRHGGRAWAEGKIDQGATFHFWLPDRPTEQG